VRSALKHAAAATLVLGVAAALGLAAADDPIDDPQVRRSDGPLQVPPGHGYFDVVVEPNQGFADGLETLRVDGSQPITIDAVSIVGDEEIVFLGAMVAPPEARVGTTHIVRSWPPESGQDALFDSTRLVSATDAVIEPYGGDSSAAYELFIGMRIDEVGTFERKAIRIDYRLGDIAYTATFEAEAKFCVAVGGKRAADPCRNALD